MRRAVNLPSFGHAFRLRGQHSKADTGNSQMIRAP
jgi:hypothetical protein